MDLTSDNILHPGEIICPKIGNNDVSMLVQRLYGLKANCVKQLNSYDDKNFLVEVLQESDNPHIQDISSNGYVLKILNSKDSMHQDIVEAQNDLLNSLFIPGISVPIPVKNINGSFLSVESIHCSEQNISKAKSAKSTIPSQNDRKYIVRLFTFVPGKLMKEVAYTRELLFELGELAGKFGNALKDFSNASITNRKYRWQLTSVPDLHQYIFTIKDPEKQALVKEIFAAWTSTVELTIPLLGKGIIHSDLNEQNILVNPDNSHICGVLDFGDVTYAPYVFDLAIAIAYVLFEVHPVELDEAVSNVVAGYVSQRRIIEEEWSILKECVAARCAQSLVLGAYSHNVNPDNLYVLATAKKGWERLRRMWYTSKDHLIRNWQAAITY